MPRFDWLLLLIAYLSLFFYGFIDSSRGPIFPDVLKEFSLSDSLGSLFFMVVSLTAMINNIFSFVWLKKWSSIQSLRIFSVVQIVAVLGMACSNSFIVLLLGAAMLGVSMGGLGIVVNLLVVEATPEKYHRQALSGLHSTYGLSSLFAPLLVNVFYGHGLSWHIFFAVLSLGPLVLLMFSMLHRQSRKDVIATSKAGSERSLRPKNLSLIAATVLGAAVACGVVAEVSLSSRLVLFARRDLGQTAAEANDLLSLFFLAYIGSRLAFTLIRIPVKTVTVLMASAVASIVLVGIGLSGFPIWLAVSGVPISIFYPYSMAYLGEVYKERAPWVISWCQTAQAFALMVMQFLLGLLSDRFGLGVALWLGPLAFAFSLAYFFSRNHRKIAL